MKSDNVLNDLPVNTIVLVLNSALGHRIERDGVRFALHNSNGYVGSYHTVAEALATHYAPERNPDPFGNPDGI